MKLRYFSIEFNLAGNEIFDDVDAQVVVRNANLGKEEIAERVSILLKQN